VLYSVAADHFVQVAFLIHRGAQFADRCLVNVQDIVHCKECQCWAVLSNPCNMLYGKCPIISFNLRLNSLNPCISV